MRKISYYCCVSLFLALVCAPNYFSKPTLLLNRIEGIVYDPGRVPISDVRVELQDEMGSLLKVTKTMSGRFTFSGISSGHFLVRVVPVGLSFLEEKRDVEVLNVTRNGSDTEYIEIYLRYDKRGQDDALPNRPAEAIFVQEVPKDAKRLYESGVANLKRDRTKGLADLDEAVKIFPNYFDALMSLGEQYKLNKEYQKSYPYFLKAIDINPRSPTAFYSLAYTFMQLNEIPAAVQAAKATTVLAPSYTDAHLLYGILLRINGNYKEAETSLLKAESLSKLPNAEVHWQLALLYNKLKRNKEAADQLETYLKIYPNSPDKLKVQELIAKLRVSK